MTDVVKKIEENYEILEKDYVGEFNGLSTPPVALFVNYFRILTSYFEGLEGEYNDIFKQKLDTKLQIMLDRLEFDKDAIQFDFYMEKYNVTTRELCEYMVFLLIMKQCAVYANKKMSLSQLINMEVSLRTLSHLEKMR